MHAHQHNGADAPSLATREQVSAKPGDPAKLHPAARATIGRSPPQKDESPRLAGTERFRDQEAADSADCATRSPSEQAASAIEGEAYACAFLDRMHADVAQPGELAALPSFLDGEMLNGACRLIEKRLRGGCHA